MENCIHKADEQVSDWKTAFTYLREGNHRYWINSPINRETSRAEREILCACQKPFAAILTCSDSRTAPEIYFDQKQGDLFVIRNAGNISCTMTLGSLEFAVEHLKVPLVVVVGHSSCGAVNGSFCGGNYSENLQKVIDTIKPAIKDCNDLNDAINANINYTVKKIRDNRVIRSMKTVVVGAYYNIETGRVIF